ncbi:unnamed protein product [Amoebophrya sp. A120]|nr:unnamed protein product [Amoebophrya sp. A120]|eukprot:GSA120T00014771001.1
MSSFETPLLQTTSSNNDSSLVLSKPTTLMSSTPPNNNIGSTAPSKVLVDATKITTFAEFYPYYLTEHRKPLTKVLHCVGTLFAIPFGATLLYYLAFTVVLLTYYALLFALSLGRSDSLRKFLQPATVENDNENYHLDCFLSMIGQNALKAALCGYSFAWGAHFFVEQNKPVTLKSLRCAVFSLLGDCRMCFECLVLGKHDLRFWKDFVGAGGRVSKDDD